MALTSGTHLGSYEILAPIGAGGMGEVYKARDRKLGRDVAIKVLPEEFSRDAERLARFEREAKLLASLNHSNIATLYGLEDSNGLRFLAMELVEGETLAERIARGPIPEEEAIPLFLQIAEALEAAHEKSIIHRDLKPANVKVTEEGKVKVLDFGLAKAFMEDVPGSGLSESPTVTRGTAAGVILGTAPYMSPEQARGKPVDKRSDVWSFGCCLYETLTGRPAFLGETVSDTIAAILKNEPEWSALDGAATPGVRRLLRRCLQRDGSRRLRDIADARIELEEAKWEPTEPATRLAGASKATALLAALAVAAILVAIWSLLRPGDAREPRVWHAAIPLPHGHELDLLGWAPSVAISPDARWVAYVSRDGPSSRLYLRRMDQSEAQPLTGAEGAVLPFFSPDSQWLGYQLGLSGKLMKVSVGGATPGPPVTIADFVGIERGASWGPDGIVFNRGFNLGLSRISAEGGEPEVLTTPIRERGEKTHRQPDVLPGGKALLFVLGTGDLMSYDDASIAVLDLETREYRVLLEGGTHPRYSPTGHIVYARNGSLLAAPFDLDTLEVEGASIPVVSGVATSPYQGAADFDLSDPGTLVYAPGGAWGDDDRIVWVDRKGALESLVDIPGDYGSAMVSPDGRSLVVYIEAANSIVGVYDIARGTMTRLTFDFDNNMPIWTPDGERVTFRSSRTGPLNLFWQSISGGPAEQLTTSDYAQIVGSWSPNGRVLAFGEIRPTTGEDLWTLDLEGDREPKLFLQTPFNETVPQFSPDGRWIAYQSDESGRYETYLIAFPTARGKIQVSTAGGTDPRWNPNGRELFYRDGEQVMAVDVSWNGDPRLGKPQLLFRHARLVDYDVAPDGERFAVIDESQAPPPPSHLKLVVNWAGELERLVPSEN